MYNAEDNFDQVIADWLNLDIEYPTMKANNIPETLQMLFDTYRD